MYFKKIPNIYYQFDIGNKTPISVVKDITANVRIRKEALEKVTLYDEYDLRDGETPEILAARYYGSPTYHWIIMLANQRYDYINDFPLSSANFEQYMIERYPDTSTWGDVHHYIDSQGFIVGGDAPGAIQVSNYDHEHNLNESKRRIKLIAPSLIQQIISEFKTLI